jgi:molecular chaperone GrpE
MTEEHTGAGDEPSPTEPDLPESLNLTSDDTTEMQPAEPLSFLPAEAVDSVLSEDGPETDPVAGAVVASGADVAEPSAPVAGLIDALGERLERRLDALQTLFDREIRAEATREKVVDRLHAELQEYKQDLLLNTLRPVFIDLIQLHDDIGKVAVAGPEIPDEVRRLVGLMQGFQQGIEDVLYRQGVEPFEVEGDAFDARRQRAVATLPTADPSRNKAVAVRHRKGFRAGDRVIRPEVVSVFAFKPE